MKIVRIQQIKFNKHLPVVVAAAAAERFFRSAATRIDENKQSEPQLVDQMRNDQPLFEYLLVLYVLDWTLHLKPDIIYSRAHRHIQSPHSRSAK